MAPLVKDCVSGTAYTNPIQIIHYNTNGTASYTNPFIGDIQLSEATPLSSFGHNHLRYSNKDIYRITNKV